MAKRTDLKLSNMQINDLMTVTADYGIDSEFLSDEKASQFFSELLITALRSLNHEQWEAAQNSI